MSAIARSDVTRPSSRPAAARSRRPTLREAPAPAPSVAGNGMFALIVAGLLVLGMLGLLVLNTTLAQGAFEIGALTKVQRDLAVNEQRLLQKVAQAEAPESLQRRADTLGMVPAQAPVFLRLSDSRVLGRPTPAKATARRASGSTAASTTPSTSDAATTTASSGSTSTKALPGSTTTSPSTSDEARPDAPTAGSMSDEAVPDAPTGDTQP